jgi:hypothetical protein
VRFSPPPNDRGSDVPQFVSGPDLRKHRWLIAARIAPIVLSALATAGRVAAGEARTTGELAWLVAKPVTPARAHRVISALRNLNAQPCVARCDITDKSEAIQ